jgi:hypothetical protein
MKKCVKCGIEKALDGFYKEKRNKDGRRSDCKSCFCDRKKKYYKENREKVIKIQKKYHEKNIDRIAKRVNEYYEKNRKKILKKSRERYQNNKESILKKEREYYQNNKESILERNREYYENNIEKILKGQNEYVKKRYSSDPIFRTICSLRDQTRRLGDYKNDSTIKIIGCSAKEFWEMNGSPSSEELKSLHIDHIIPLSWFDMTNEDHVRVASHHTNLQYLTADDNWAKSDRYAGSPSSIIAYKGEFDIDEHVQKTITYSSF